MKPILMLMAALGVAACITDPTPGRSPYCIEVGDTLGVIRRVPAGTVTECIWILADTRECFEQRVQTKVTTCAVGDKWP